MASRTVLYLVTLTLVGLVPGLLGAQHDESSYTDRTLGVRVTAPKGWSIHRQTGFPALLIYLLPDEGAAKINVALVHRPRGKTLRTLIAENNRALEAIKISVGKTETITLRDSTLWQVAAHTPTQGMIQIYVPLPGRADAMASGTGGNVEEVLLVFSLAAPPAELPAQRLQLLDIIAALDR